MLVILYQLHCRKSTNKFLLQWQALAKYTLVIMQSVVQIGDGTICQGRLLINV